MKANHKLDTLRPSFFSRKVQGSLKSIVALSLEQHLSQSVVIVSKLAYLMYRKHSSWKDHEIVYRHLLTRNFASFLVRKLFEGPTTQFGDSSSADIDMMSTSSSTAE